MLKKNNTMSKRGNILLALLLIAAGVVVNFLSGRTDGSVDIELTGLFSGILFGAGLAFLAQIIIPKRKTKQPEKE
jgi:membrane associated rhomboid family serine protease